MPAGVDPRQLLDVLYEKRVADCDNVFDLGDGVSAEIPHHLFCFGSFWFVEANPKPFFQGFVGVEVALHVVQLVKRCFLTMGADVALG